MTNLTKNIYETDPKLSSLFFWSLKSVREFLDFEDVSDDRRSRAYAASSLKIYEIKSVNVKNSEHFFNQ